MIRKHPLAGVRLILADDHASVRFGFRALFESAGATVVGEAETGEQALQVYAAQGADVLVMDISMPGKGGLLCLEQLLARSPQARVLMLSALHDVAVPLRALNLGARGFLCKRAGPEEVIRAVAAVAAGDRYIDPELAQELALAQFSGTGNPTRALTDREFAVFLRLAAGQSVQAVAASFHVSPSTVGTHLYHIKQKLNLENGAQMTLLAVRSGLMEV